MLRCGLQHIELKVKQTDGYVIPFFFYFVIDGRNTRLQSKVILLFVSVAYQHLIPRLPRQLPVWVAVSPSHRPLHHRPLSLMDRMLTLPQPC